MASCLSSFLTSFLFVLFEAFSCRVSMQIRYTVFTWDCRALMEGSKSKHSANLRTAISPVFNYISQQSSQYTVRCLSILMLMLVLKRWIFRLSFSLRLQCNRAPPSSESTLSILTENIAVFII